MQTWIIPTLGALLLWGLWGFFPKMALNYISPKSALIYELLGSFIVGLGVAYFINFKPEFHLKGAIYATLAGMCGLSGGLFFLYALKSGKLSVVTPISAMYPIVTVLIAVIFLGEAISYKECIGILLAMVSIFLLAT